LYQRKMGPGTIPPTVDVLVEQRFLRKKFKDPVTGEDFVALPPATAVQPAQGGGAGAGAGRGGQNTGAGGNAQRSGFGGSPVGQQPGTSTPGAVVAGVGGVTSKSKEASIRIYNGRTHYNEWEFRYQPPPQAAGANSG